MSMAPSSLPKKVQSPFTKSVEDSRTLRVVRHSRRVFEVERMSGPNTMRIVDLEEGTCSCGFSNEFGVPCHHLCVASLFLKENLQQFILHVRQLDSLRETYRGVTLPVDCTLLRNNGS